MHSDDAIDGDGTATDPMRARAVEMYQQGARTKDIQAETGVSRPRLYALLQREGIAPKRIRRSAPRVSTLAVTPPDGANGDLVARLLRQERELGMLEAKVDQLQDVISFLSEELTASRQRTMARRRPKADSQNLS